MSHHNFRRSKSESKEPWSWLVQSHQLVASRTLILELATLHLAGDETPPVLLPFDTTCHFSCIPPRILTLHLVREQADSAAAEGDENMREQLLLCSSVTSRSEKEKWGSWARGFLVVVWLCQRDKEVEGTSMDCCCGGWGVASLDRVEGTIARSPRASCFSGCPSGLLHGCVLYLVSSQSQRLR